MIKYTLKRFELLGEPPTRRAVGFTLTNEDNNKTHYIEEVMSLDELDSADEYEICKYIFDKIQPKIKKIEEKLQGPSIVGSDFIP